jgi:hypothetical protein
MMLGGSPTRAAVSPTIHSKCLCHQKYNETKFQSLGNPDVGDTIGNTVMALSRMAESQTVISAGNTSRRNGFVSAGQMAKLSKRSVAWSMLVTTIFSRLRQWSANDTDRGP